MLRNKIKPDAFLQRFTAFNICCFAGLIVALALGWIKVLASTDPTIITIIIIFTFAWGWLLSCRRATGLNLIANHVSGLINRLHMTPTTIGLRIAAEIQSVQQLAYLLLFEGAAGILVGMMHYQIETAASIGLLGVLSHIWLITNYNMMSTLRQRILASLMEQYERVV